MVFVGICKGILAVLLGLFSFFFIFGWLVASALLAFFPFFEKVINFPAQLVGQAAQAGPGSGGYFAVFDFFFQDLLDQFPNFVEQYVINH